MQVGDVPVDGALRDFEPCAELLGGDQTAAAQVFWGKSAERLTKRECALLAAVLPNPKLRRAQAPSAFVARRAKKIETQMANLGGVRFLKRIQ